MTVSQVVERSSQDDCGVRVRVWMKVEGIKWMDGWMVLLESYGRFQQVLMSECRIGLYGQANKERAFECFGGVIIM